MCVEGYWSGRRWQTLSGSGQDCITICIALEATDTVVEDGLKGDL